MEEALDDTSYKQWSCHKLLCKLCRNLQPPAMGARFTIFGQAGHAEQLDGLALLLIKAADVETNSDPTTTHKQVWICDIGHKQIHGRKQISIRCNSIEQCVHLRCAGIRQAQYTDTWTCHLHIFRTHTDITQSHTSRPVSKPPIHSPHTPPQPKHTFNTPCYHRMIKHKANPLTHSPPTLRTQPRAKHIPMSHTPPTPLTTLISSTSPALDNTPEPRVPHIYALTATTPTLDPTPALPSLSHPHILAAHTHMQHKQQYTHHSHCNNRTHNIGYHDNLTDRPRTTTGL